MIQKSDSVADLLDRLSEKGSTKWIEDGNYRRANKAWLNKSALIALRILRVLREKGISQKDLATMLDVSPQYVSKILKGRENLSLETICRIEAVLEIALVEVVQSNLYLKTAADFVAEQGEDYGTVVPGSKD